MNKKLALTAGTAAAAAAALPLLMLAPGRATRRQKAPFMGLNCAHRGLHSRDMKVPENSIEAFRLAAEAGYGIELDVQLSKDGQVVVFHDDTLDRVCGIRSRVDEKDYSELRALSLCGSEYGIPLFTEVLSTVHGRSPIIVELKTGKHNRELCEKTCRILSEYRGEVCVESFDPRIVAWFRFHAKDLLRGQLAAPTCDYASKASPSLVKLMSHCWLNFLGRPQFISYKIGRRYFSVHLAELMGAMRVGWTSHDPRNEKKRDTVIFEFYKPRIRFK
ncbi:MAG: glycerophosphodiester phosphodiesterase family protein [Candidatus Limivicinus sp.]|jgi:glycerophosphoryl diester phosphodiesterase